MAGAVAEPLSPTGMAEAGPIEAAPRPEPEPPGSAISRALAEVMDVVEALKGASEQMEEALELVELAERQKIADEHEIESLRRALHQLHRPRGSRAPAGEDPHPHA